MQLIDAAGLGSKGEYTRSAETLYWLSHITRNSSYRIFSGTPKEVAAYMLSMGAVVEFQPVNVLLSS
jgi:hypothetical protein